MATQPTATQIGSCADVTKLNTELPASCYLVQLEGGDGSTVQTDLSLTIYDNPRPIGLHLNWRLPNIEVHIPFGIFRVDWKYFDDKDYIAYIERKQSKLKTFGIE